MLKEFIPNEHATGIDSVHILQNLTYFLIIFEFLIFKKLTEIKERTKKN